MKKVYLIALCVLVMFIAPLSIFGAFSHGTLRQVPITITHTPVLSPASNAQAIEKEIGKETGKKHKRKKERKLTEQQIQKEKTRLEKEANKNKQEQLLNMPQYFVDNYVDNTTQTLPSLIIKQQHDADYKKLNLLFTRIEFTQEGITSFFHHTLNRREYGTDLLPHNFTHFVQFMAYAKQSQQSPEFVESVIRLFTQKIKASSYVSAPAFEKLLTESAPFFEYHLAQKDATFWDNFKNTLVTFFKNNFAQLQESPLSFFDTLSHSINQKISSEILSPERARFTLVRFLTSSLDKVIWSPDDQLKTWQSCKKIGSILQELHTQRVIPDALDANDLYWSLIERYCYFMELVGTKLTLDTCSAIKRDITNREISWLMTPEQEEGIQTKTERLVLVLLETEAAIKAAKQGIFSEKSLII